MKKRILSLVLALSLCASLLIAPVRADGISFDDLEKIVDNLTIPVGGQEFDVGQLEGYIIPSESVWNGNHTTVTYDILENAVFQLQYVNPQISFSISPISLSRPSSSTSSTESGYYGVRVIIPYTYAVYWLTNGNGKALVARPASSDITSINAIPRSLAAAAGAYRMLSYEDLYNLAYDYNSQHNYNLAVNTDGVYWAISSRGDYVLANESGLPYGAVGPSAVNGNGNERPLVNSDVIGDTIMNWSNNTVGDADGGIINFDGAIYDSNNKTYYIDAHHDTTNNYYNYSYTYNINHTTITYIGSSAEYTEQYECYYQLPDGRSSADLTKEELEQLNLNVDVVPYDRTTEDTSLWALYHFDGDTRDSSYWNYRSNFKWNTGASITYLDSANFNGCLYLDEKTHDFTFEVPSMIGIHYVVSEFRYYQSATETPVNDSFVNVGGETLLRFDGNSLMNGSNTVLAEMPVGSWSSIAICRNTQGRLFYYLNGVCVGSASNSTNFDNKITFHFGNEQQTYKYLDEIRVLQSRTDKTHLNRGANYTPATVPFDTNLSLVLPEVSDYSIPFNQLVINGDFSQGSTGWTGRYSSVSDVSNNVASVTATSSGDVRGLSSSITYSFIENHKYYFSADILSPVDSFVRFSFGGGLSRIPSVAPYVYSNVWSHASSIWAYSSDSSSSRSSSVCIYLEASVDSGVVIKYKNVQVFDLTAMFGAGNEPDQETAVRLFSELSFVPPTTDATAYVRDGKIVSVDVHDGDLVADEWVSVDYAENLLTQGDFRVAAPSAPNLVPRQSYQGSSYLYEDGSSQFVKSSNISLTSFDGGVRVSNSGSSFAPNDGVSADALFIPFGSDVGNYGNRGYPEGDYTLTVVFTDGSTSSLSLRQILKTRTYGGYSWDDCSALPTTLSPSFISFPWGKIGFSNGLYYSNLPYSSTSSDLMSSQIGFYIAPDAGKSVDIAYIVLEKSSTSSVIASLNSAIVNVDMDAFTPTLAVRTDIGITKKQFGGVRPILPGRGDVYAMVENGFITSLQQYDGSAWVQVDGRIWTGKRWVPYSSYNVVTLTDCYDIADASGQGGYEYIYSETGFWSWWQKQWLEFKQWYTGVEFSVNNSFEYTNEKIKQTVNNVFMSIGEINTQIEEKIETTFNVDIDIGTGQSNSLGLLSFVQKVFGDLTSGLGGFTSTYLSPDDSLDVIFVPPPPPPPEEIE